MRNNDVLSRAGIPSSHFHVNAVYAGWATGWTMDASPKDLLYGELATTGARLSGRPLLRFKDICKRGTKACNIDTNAWETLADNRNLWKQQVSQGRKSGEAAIVDKSDERLKSQKNNLSPAGQSRSTTCVCFYMPGSQQRL